MSPVEEDPLASYICMRGPGLPLVTFSLLCLILLIID